MFDLQRDLINNTGKREYNSEELAKTEKYIHLENETKRNLVKSMNIFLEKNVINDANFRFCIKCTSFNPFFSKNYSLI